MPPPTAETSAPRVRVDLGVRLRKPMLEDGGAMWRMARDSQVLDLNSSYSYLLWCRDFAATSVVATVDGEPAGYVTGYRRPDRPDTLMVWQVAVDEAHRGKGLAGAMLGWLVDATASTRMETTITEANAASIRLFESFAESRDADVEREPVFTDSLFPDGHETELLFTIGPLRDPATTALP